MGSGTEGETTGTAAAAEDAARRRNFSFMSSQFFCCRIGSIHRSRRGCRPKQASARLAHRTGWSKPAIHEGLLTATRLAIPRRFGKQVGLEAHRLQGTPGRDGRLPHLMRHLPVGAPFDKQGVPHGHDRLQHVH